MERCRRQAPASNHSPSLILPPSLTWHAFCSFSMSPLAMEMTLLPPDSASDRRRKDLSKEGGGSGAPLHARSPRGKEVHVVGQHRQQQRQRQAQRVQIPCTTTAAGTEVGQGETDCFEANACRPHLSIPLPLPMGSQDCEEVAGVPGARSPDLTEQRQPTDGQLPSARTGPLAVARTPLVRL